MSKKKAPGKPGRLQKNHQARAISSDHIESAEAMQIATSISTATAHSGPLPHHTDFQAYEAVLPGTAERILAMAEREQTQRHRMLEAQDQRDAIAYNGVTAATRRGQWMSFGLGAGIIASGLVAVLTGSAVAGSTIIVGGTAATILAFLHGKKPAKPTKSEQAVAASDEDDEDTARD